MRKSNWTPSIVPNGNDHTVYLVADNFGRIGLAWREADYEAIDLKTALQDLLPVSTPTRSGSSPSARPSVGRRTSTSRTNCADAAIFRCAIGVATSTAAPDAPDMNHDVQRQKPNAISIKAPLPEFIEPGFATSIEKAPSRARWLDEIKFDGYRVQLHFANEAAKVFTRGASSFFRGLGEVL
jgi:ATP-dependent DNA ligase